MPFYKEPLFHFFLLGLAIFGWFSFLNPDDQSRADLTQITVDDVDVDRLILQFQTTWRRPPTLDELTSLLDGLVREEVLVREARELGLDRGDSVIRSRLAQKMSFLTLSLAQSAEPEDGVLQEHLSENSERFLRPGEIAFQQIGLGPDPGPETIDSAIVGLNSGASPDEFGVPSLLPAMLELTRAQQVDGTFGRGFFDAISSLPPGQWAGPVTSGYGAHIVRVDAIRQPAVPAFEDVRDEVLFDWRRELKSELADAQINELKRNFDISMPTQDQLSERLSQ
ncbi:MAG: peptidylprolyl isomerase [Rhodobacteraceae bacterium]|nr:peptidylprolyl isomerase [Paracoccaceae bacterium]